MTDIPLSLLELSVIEAGRSASDTIPGTLEVARRADELGFHRIWYPEHHRSPVLPDFPPAIVAAQVAAVTSRIRVGSGGVLAPNHTPLLVAEHFGALAAFHPGRIDLGIGRGPGTFDEAAIRMLRRGAPAATDEEYAGSAGAILELVGERPDVPEPWLLSSSAAGAALAAELGVPMAFAYHLRPANAVEAVERYREAFKPSRWSDSPRVMIGVETICADTEAEAARLSLPADIVHACRLSGQGEQTLLSPDAAADRGLTSREQELLEASHVRAQGAAEQVERRLAAIAEQLGADELMVVMPIFDRAARIRSLELVAASPTRAGASPC